MDEADKGYLAALLDGEGSVMMDRLKSGNFDLRVSIGMTDPTAIIWGHNLTGLGSINFNQRDRRKGMFHNHSNFHRWTMSCRHGVEFLKLVMPYLKVKDKQAKLYLEAMEIRNKSGKREEKRKAQETIYANMKVLNSRGA